MSGIVAISDRMLARDIEHEHRAAEEAGKAWARHAARCGSLLLEAQAACQIPWLEWVETNLSFGERTAQRYMRFARAARVKPDLMTSHSTFSDALDAIADRRAAHPLGPGSAEFFTPQPFLEAARATLGSIDVDVASCELAQRQVRAKTYFTKQTDGLSHEWSGAIWANPPYREVARFVSKLLEEIGAGRVTEAILLTNCYSETLWFQQAAAACSAICFPRDRVYFLRPNEGDLTKSAFGSALFFYGKNVSSFRQNFEQFGIIVLPARDAP